MQKRVLVIAPHPDDETLGVGGTIAMHAEKGDEVYWCIVTKAYEPEWSREFIEKREEEIEQVEKIFGFKKTFKLGLPTVKLDILGQKKINDEISEVIKKVKPDIVYLPFMHDLNTDHKMVFNAGIVACRPINEHKVERILCYETLSETEGGYLSAKFVPNHYVDIERTIESKLNAMKVYFSELKEFPHPRSLEGIKILAMKRGSECGLKMAEAFYVIRSTVY